MLTIDQREITGPGTGTHLATALSGDLHSKRVWPTPFGSAQRSRLLASPGPAATRPARSPDHARARITLPPAAHKPQPQTTTRKSS